MEETEEKKKKTTSGFTEDISKEMSNSNPLPVEDAFSNLHQCYVSISGHTRIFTATKYGKRFMLKCLKNDFLYTPIYRQALAKEFEIGQQLEHPNICRTIDLEKVDNLGTVVVMEYIDGDNLEQLIKKNALSAELARKIAGQLMDALEYMHNKQMIHRDLKPSNIMITHNGQNVKLIDFGLSDSDSFCVLKSPAGTSGYIAPENRCYQLPRLNRVPIFILWAWFWATWPRLRAIRRSARWQKSVVAATRKAVRKTSPNCANACPVRPVTATPCSCSVPSSSPYWQPWPGVIIIWRRVPKNLHLRQATAFSPTTIR